MGKKIKQPFLNENQRASIKPYFYLNEFKNAAILIFSGGLLVFIASILISIFGKE